MSRVNETRFQFNMNCVIANVDRIKVHVIKSKNEIIMNGGVSVKNYMIEVLVKINICAVLGNVNVNVIKCNFKIVEHLDITNCYCEKRLIGKLVPECEKKILNTTENLLNDKKSSISKI